MTLLLCTSGMTSHICCTCRMTHLRCLSSWTLLMQMRIGTKSTALKGVTNSLVSSGTCFQSWRHTSITPSLSRRMRLCRPSLTKKKATLLLTKLGHCPRRSSSSTLNGTSCRLWSSQWRSRKAMLFFLWKQWNVSDVAVSLSLKPVRQDGEGFRAFRRRCCTSRLSQ